MAPHCMLHLILYRGARPVVARLKCFVSLLFSDVSRGIVQDAVGRIRPGYCKMFTTYPTFRTMKTLSTFSHRYDTSIDLPPPFVSSPNDSIAPYNLACLIANRHFCPPLFSCCSFGIGFWRTERVSRKFSGDTLGLVAAQLLTVAVLAGGWCVQAGNFPASIDSLRDVLFPASGSLAVPIALMWTGFMTTALTVFAETIAMQRVSASESTIILSTEPLWGTAFAAALLGERIGWNTGLGAMLIVSACTWTSVGPKLQKNLLGLIAATGAAGTVGETVLADVDVDDLSETVELVKDFVHDRL